MERTLTHQHRKVIEQEKVSISVFHRIPLFREEISSTALAKALALRNNYQLVHQEPCTGLAKENVGILCIHEIRALSPFHNSTVIGIYPHLQKRKLLQLTHDCLC